MSGLLPGRTRVYDNAAEFASDLPTFAHHLRRAGYQTCLSGKMHFVGPDQLHGFEERLTTDIYPARLRLDPRLDKAPRAHRLVVPQPRLRHRRRCRRDHQPARIRRRDSLPRQSRSLHDLSRRQDPRPWCLTVSFTHPHDPYVARPRFWDLYADCPALDPVVPAIPIAGRTHTASA